MKLTLTVLSLTLCCAMAMATFNAFYREDPPNNAFHQDEQDSNIDQGTGQDHPTAVVQQNSIGRGDLKLSYNSRDTCQQVLQIYI